MPFDQKQSEILMQHVQGKGLICPSCQNKSWHLVDIITLPMQGTNVLTLSQLAPVLLKQAAGRSVPDFTVAKVLSGKDEKGLPVAILGCSVCYFLMTFGWRPIVEDYLKRTSGGEKL